MPHGQPGGGPVSRSRTVTSHASYASRVDEWPTATAGVPAGAQRIGSPEMARAMTSRWISDVPSKIV